MFFLLTWLGGNIHLSYLKKLQQDKSALFKQVVCICLMKVAILGEEYHHVIIALPFVVYIHGTKM